MHVCIHVTMCKCIHTSMSLFEKVCRHICMNADIHKCFLYVEMLVCSQTHTNAYACVYVCMNVCYVSRGTCKGVYIFECKYVCIYVDRYARISVYMYVCIFVGNHVSVCIRHVSLYVCMHMCVHVWAHAHISMSQYVCIIHAYIHICMNADKNFWWALSPRRPHNEFAELTLQDHH